MSLTGFQRRRRQLAKRKALEEQKKQEEVKKLSIDDLTKDEIIAKLKEKGIEHNPRDKKEILFKLLVGD